MKLKNVYALKRGVMIEKRTCCGNSLDLSKLGTCPFCIALALAGTLIFWTLYFYFGNFWLKTIFFIWAVSFSTMMIAHITGWLTRRPVKDAAGLPGNADPHS